LSLGSAPCLFGIVSGLLRCCSGSSHRAPTLKFGIPCSLVGGYRGANLRGLRVVHSRSSHRLLVRMHENALSRSIFGAKDGAPLTSFGMLRQRGVCYGPSKFQLPRAMW
jgi:hypothetical protein